MARQCKDCGKPITKGSKLGRCKSCAGKATWRRKDYRETISEVRKQSWADGVYDDRQNPWDNPEYRASQSAMVKEKWQDPEYIRKRTEAHLAAMKRPDVRAKIGAASKALWQDPEYREPLLQSRKEVWEDPEFRTKHSAATKAACQSPEWKAAHTWHGPDHPNWCGGDTEYGPEFNDELKEYIRERDDHQCVICGISEDGRAHDCHHLDYDKLNNDPINLVTLCIPCHRRTNYNRRFWCTILAPIAVERERR